jgi:hypothetical protein
VALFCNPASGGTFSSTAIEIIKWVKKFAVAQAKVTHILRPGKASEKTQKGVIPPSLCEISQNASRKNKHRAELYEYPVYYTAEPRVISFFVTVICRGNARKRVAGRAAGALLPFFCT